MTLNPTIYSTAPIVALETPLLKGRCCLYDGISDSNPEKLPLKSTYVGARPQVAGSLTTSSQMVFLLLRNFSRLTRLAGSPIVCATHERSSSNYS